MDYVSPIVNDIAWHHAVETLLESQWDVVSTLLLNTPPMLEAHYGVPMLGAVLNAINTRLDAAGTAYDRVIQMAETIGADLILISAHSPELKDYLLGSNAARIACSTSGSIPSTKYSWGTPTRSP